MNPTIELALYRGRDVETGEWRYGCLWHDNDAVIIRSIDTNAIYWIVDQDTVGQWIGLRDKNGTLIFYGDVDTEGRVFVYDVGNGGWYRVKNGDGTQWSYCVCTHGGTRLPFELTGKTIHDGKGER